MGATRARISRDPTRPGASNALDFVAIGRRFPEAMIIYGHIGGGGDREYVCKILRDAPTIYATYQWERDHEGMVDFAVRCLGVKRLLFATDLSFETGVGKVLAARLTEAERRRIFFENLNDILRAGGEIMSIDVNTYIGHFPFRQLRGNTAQGLVSYMDRFAIERGGSG